MLPLRPLLKVGGNLIRKQQPGVNYVFDMEFLQGGVELKIGWF